jgi:NADH-quinone oxidoreductase subunit C
LSSAEATQSTATTPTVTDGDQARARLDSLVTELGDDVLGSEVVRNGDILIRVAASAWKRAAEACKAQGYDYFCFLSGLDWMPSTSPNPRASVSDELDTGDDEAPEARGEAEEEAEAVADNEAAVADAEADADAGPASGLGYPTGVGGGDTRFQVFARLYSTTRHEGVTLKADLDPDAPSVETWCDLYPGSDWNERETWEMYGFVFQGHPNLVKLYLPGEFEGFPLRKDFPLLAREVKPWPGLVDVEPMPESAETETTTSEPPAAAPEAAAPPAEPKAETTTSESPAAAPEAAAPPAPAKPEPAADAAPEPAAPPAEPATPPPAEDSVPATAEEAHATGTESATTGAAAEAASTEDPEG